MIARVYMYSGMWVADCPRGCGNTELVFEKITGGFQKRKTEYRCSYCNLSTYQFEWPSNLDDIETILKMRPVPHNRNWYPRDHDVAVRFRIPHGQTLDELREENIAHDIPTP